MYLFRNYFLSIYYLPVSRLGTAYMPFLIIKKVNVSFLEDCKGRREDGGRSVHSFCGNIAINSGSVAVFREGASSWRPECHPPKH